MKARTRLILGIAVAVMLLAGSAGAQSWKFIITGDSRGSGGSDQVNSNVLMEIADAIVAESPDLVMFSGDLVNSGSLAAFKDWTNAMSVVYAAGIPLYPLRGNHDQGAGWTNIFAEYLPNNGPAAEEDFTFYVTNKNALLVALDQYFAAHRVNRPWLDDILGSNTLPHVFVFSHEPAFKCYHTDCMDDYPADRDAFWHSIRSAGAKTYFCGHDHFFDHARIADGDGNSTNDLHHYIVGTAGAPLYTYGGPYDGVNTAWTPTAVLRHKTNGFVTVEVDGYDVTVTWRPRAGPGVFSYGNVLTYNALDQFRAYDPDPTDGETLVPAYEDLSWQGSLHATSRDLFFGTNRSEVLTATTNSPLFKGNQAGTTYDPGPLESAKAYWWRVDEHVFATSLVGSVWEFTTRPMGKFIYVATGGGHSAPYTNWAMAATNIQDAVAEAVAGDTVLVSNGTYVLTAAVTVTNAITVRGVDGPESVVVNANGVGRCFVLSGSGAILEDLTMTGGYIANLPGAGIWCGAGTVVRNCVVTENMAFGFPAQGGGIYCSGGTIENCTIVSNVASGFPEEGGGVLCDSGATIVNTIMYYNMAGDGPNLHNDSGTVSFSCATPAMGGTSNITDVPLFADAGVGGFRLSSGSPCIDTGTDRPGVDADMDGVPRPLIGSLQTQAAFDMGAYEFVHATADTDGDELGDADELVAGTDPTDGTDVFMVDSAVPTALGDVITWNTVSGRYYTVMTTTNLPDTWENVGNPAYTNVMGLGLSLSYTNSDPDVATRYFMLKVRDE